MATVNGLDAFKEDHTVKVIDTSKKLRVGIIGTGWIAEMHMKSYLNQPDVEIVAGADLPDGPSPVGADVIAVGNLIRP